MEIEVVGMNGNAFVLKSDDDLDAIAFGARGKDQKWMLVKTELGENAVEACVGFRHRGILAEGESA